MEIKYLVLAFLFLLGCGVEQKNAYIEIDDEIEKLISNDDKRNYLEEIFKDDQNIRGSQGSEIMLKFGKKSQEYYAYVKKQHKQDSINLIKIEIFFNKYGHPNKSEVGELAAQTPWAVIHHASSFEDRERNFEYMYEAYLKGDIDDGAISMFLGRMYEIKNRKRFRMESPFNAEDEIDQLIKELKLEEKKANAQQRL